jgi:hypothetical protein
MPHAYDAGPEQEVAQYLQARAIGADGVQTNQPELIVAAAGRPVPSRIAVRSDRGRAVAQVCLVNARNGLGVPTKQIELRKDEKRTSVTRAAAAAPTCRGRRRGARGRSSPVTTRSGHRRGWWFRARRDDPRTSPPRYAAAGSSPAPSRLNGVSS